MKKNYILITGSLGLIGHETSLFFLKKGYCVLGIDNNLRAKLFRIKTDYRKKLDFLKRNFLNDYNHFYFDIRNKKKLENLFKKNSQKITLIIHTAAQTSHDWSARDPITDFSINASGTLNLLELYRKYCPKAVFIFTSTNKVYGDRVNFFNFKETDKRFDLKEKDKYYQGIDENFPIDQLIHSPFGVSKGSADLMVQEYGRYFGLKTGIFRLGVVSGSGQNGAYYQGFLTYMIDKLKKNEPFEIIGYQGKQVRDILHPYDLAKAFYLYYKKPKKGEVYNLGGGRENSVSLIEIIDIIKRVTNKRLKFNYTNQPRKGDHKWWITNFKKFKEDYPEWEIRYSVEEILLDIYRNSHL